MLWCPCRTCTPLAVQADHRRRHTLRFWRVQVHVVLGERRQLLLGRDQFLSQLVSLDVDRFIGRCSIPEHLN
jgi:hypothetical protein